MSLQLFHKHTRVIFLLVLAFSFYRCGNDDKAREAATQAALESTEESRTSPLDKPAMAETTTGTIALSMTGKKTGKGREACVAVTARDFIEIVSMQYTMKWDPEVLRFKEVRSFGLPGMSANNFGPQAVDKGILTYSWYDANVRGISQADGSKLYEVCFEAVGEPGSQTKVEFANAPTIIEITNAGTQFLDLKGEPGVVEIH